MDDIKRAIDVLDLTDEQLVHVPFLQDTLSNRARRANEIVLDKEDKLNRILGQINDIISLQVFSRAEFDQQMYQAEKERKDTIEKIYELDRRLLKEYQYSEVQQNYAV